jgi:hypothetical protein
MKRTVIAAVVLMAATLPAMATPIYCSDVNRAVANRASGYKDKSATWIFHAETDAIGVIFNEIYFADVQHVLEVACVTYANSRDITMVLE